MDSEQQAVPLIMKVQQRLPQWVIASHQYRGHETVLIHREGFLELAQFLRDDPGMAFDFLMDTSCVDYLKFGKIQSSSPTLTTPSPLPYYMKPKPLMQTWTRLVSNDVYRFDVVYHFYSSIHNHRLRVKVPLRAAEPNIPSVSGLWATANWFEREIWDMFGIRFTGHPNLKRILMYEGFEGHPLRKDYPVRKRQPLIGPVN